jgi:hypothetical protein
MDAKIARAIGKFDIRSAMQVLVSSCLLVASLFVILAAGYDPNIKHWAFATIGTILGFWLKR